jgi:predicted Zn-dependent peptidase
VADIVSARLFIRAGSTFEAPHQAGLVSFLMGLLTKGTATRSSMAIAETVESVGASLGTDAASDYSLISLKTVSADFAEIFALAATVLRQPSFPLEEIDLERKLTLQQIRSMQEQPFTLCLQPAAAGYVRRASLRSARHWHRSHGFGHHPAGSD